MLRRAIMIEKVFKNTRSMQMLAYATTCGFAFERFIAGKGMYGNRVSTMRSKDPTHLYDATAVAKTNDFMTIECLKSPEFPQTIMQIRQKMESFFTSQESMEEFLSASKSAFLVEDDISNTAGNWYQKVGVRLLGNNTLDFSKLDNFLLGSILLYLPLPIQLKVAEFRESQFIDYVTQDLLPAEEAKRLINLFPNDKDKLTKLKQKLLIQKHDFQAKSKKTDSQSTEVDLSTQKAETV